MDICIYSLINPLIEPKHSRASLPQNLTGSVDLHCSMLLMPNNAVSVRSQWHGAHHQIPHIQFQMNTDGELEMISEKVDNCNSVIDDVINDQPTVTVRNFRVQTVVGVVCHIYDEMRLMQENGGESAAVEEVERNPGLSICYLMVDQLMGCAWTYACQSK